MTCFMEVFKDLTRSNVSDQLLHDKTFNIAIIPKYDGYDGRWKVSLD